MNVTKVMLKAVVLTALMDCLLKSDSKPTQEMIEAVHGLNNELDAYAAELDAPIDSVWQTLLAAVDTIPEDPFAPMVEPV